MRRTGHTGRTGRTGRGTRGGGAAIPPPTHRLLALTVTAVTPLEVWEPLMNSWMRFSTLYLTKWWPAGYSTVPSSR